MNCWCRPSSCLHFSRERIRRSTESGTLVVHRLVACAPQSRTRQLYPFLALNFLLVCVYTTLANGAQPKYIKATPSGAPITDRHRINPAATQGIANANAKAALSGNSGFRAFRGALGLTSPDSVTSIAASTLFCRYAGKESIIS